MDKDKVADFAASNRILISRITFSAVLFFLLFTASSWEGRAVGLTFEILGFVFIVIGGLGRIWSGVYIYGYKTKKLITTGPYAMVRNPLYFFSFFGALGAGLASRNLIVLAIIMLFFVIYYPWVVIHEENKLARRHPEAYKKYKKKVPRFIPRFNALEEPELYEVKVKKYRSVFLDVMWFFWLFAILRIINVLHQMGVMPVLFEIP